MVLRTLLGLMVALACYFLPASAKTWTVDDRQHKLMQEINEGQKSGELTVKEARKLRKEEAAIARKKAGMKAHNLGHLSKEDITSLEKDLNKVSVSLNEYRLEKRVLSKGK